MASINIFEDDWWNCLRAHFSYVVAQEDVTNEKSLLTVLHRIGLSDVEIDDVRVTTLARLGRGAEAVETESIASDEQASEAEDADAVTVDASAAEAEPQSVQFADPPVEVLPPRADLAVASDEPAEDAPPPEPDEPPAPNLSQLSLF